MKHVSDNAVISKLCSVKYCHYMRDSWDSEDKFLLASNHLHTKQTPIKRMSNKIERSLVLVIFLLCEMFEFSGII